MNKNSRRLVYENICYVRHFRVIINISVYQIFLKMVIILSKTALPVRAAEMPPFIVMDVLERAQEMEARGKSIIHMEIGERLTLPCR